MHERRENLGEKAAVKGTMVQAHLAWGRAHVADLDARLHEHLGREGSERVTRGILASEWFPLRELVRLDRAIATLAGGRQEWVYHELGRHSATQNLAGAYKNFVKEEPHRFFHRMALLHEQFQNFGRSAYERTGDRSGRITLEEYSEYSPVFCDSATGYYEGALAMLKVPGPVHAAETRCQCAGDPQCLFELSW